MRRDVAALSSEVVGATGMRCGERMQEVVGDLRRASTWRSKGNLRGPYCSSWELIAAAHEGAQAGRTSGLAIRSELGCEGGRDVPQEVVGPGPGAVVQKSPRRLEVWDLGDAGEAACGKDPVYVLVGTQRRAENEKALAVPWRSRGRDRSPVQMGSLPWPRRSEM